MTKQTKHLAVCSALSLLVVVGTLTITTKVAAAATTILNPTGGECFAGGSHVVLSWSSDDLFRPTTSYASYGNGVVPAPTYDKASNIQGADRITSSSRKVSFDWTLPNSTGSDYFIEATSLSGLQTVYSKATSQKFSIDASTPGVPVVSISSLDSSKIQLRWNAVYDAGCEPLTGYRVFRDGTQIGLTKATSYVDADRVPGVTYKYTIAAYDRFATAFSKTTAFRVPSKAAAQLEVAAPLNASINIPSKDSGTTTPQPQLVVTTSTPATVMADGNDTGLESLSAHAAMKTNGAVVPRTIQFDTVYSRIATGTILVIVGLFAAVQVLRTKSNKLMHQGKRPAETVQRAGLNYAQRMHSRGNQAARVSKKLASKPKKSGRRTKHKVTHR